MLWKGDAGAWKLLWLWQRKEISIYQQVVFFKHCSSFQILPLERVDWLDGGTEELFHCSTPSESARRATGKQLLLEHPQAVCTAPSAQGQRQGQHTRGATGRQKSRVPWRCWDVLGLDEALGRASLVNERSWHTVTRIPLGCCSPRRGAAGCFSQDPVYMRDNKASLPRCLEMCWGKTCHCFNCIQTCRARVNNTMSRSAIN